MDGIIEQVSEDLVTALQTGAVSPEDPQAGLQLVMDLLSAAHPDVPPPPYLCGWSMLVGASYVLGAHKARSF